MISVISVKESGCDMSEWLFIAVCSAAKAKWNHGLISSIEIWIFLPVRLFD